MEREVVRARSELLTLPVFREAMVEVREGDTAFKQALCAQINETIDPFGNYTSALQRIFNELEQIRVNTAPKPVEVYPTRDPRGIISPAKKKPAGKAKKKNA